MKVRIILPTYNERKNIKKLIPMIFDVFEKNSIEGDILIVDDNSPDGTWKIVKELEKKYPIKLIKRDRKMGLGSAYIIGFRDSIKNNFDIIFEMDSDFSHNPKYIPEMIKKINSGHDVVIGEREKIMGWGFHRKIISWGGNFIGRNLAGIKIKDLTTGYRAYKKEVLESIDLDSIFSEGYAFQLEMLAKSIDNGFNIDSVPIIFKDRKNGKSKLSKKDMIEFFNIALKIRTGELFGKNS